MTATAVLPRPAPAPLSPAPAHSSRAVASQRVLHTLVRRELRLLAELATWAPAGEPARTAALTRHADLIARVLLHHHRVERDLLWPALLQAVPDEDAVRGPVVEWTSRCARIDHQLRDLSTHARQWAVAQTEGARDAFALACLDLADAVDAQMAEEERVLHPLLAGHLDNTTWTAIVRSVQPDLTPREQTLVLGLAMEDACAGDRARLLSGLPLGRRLAWRTVGAGRFRAAVVRLRGAPPAV